MTGLETPAAGLSGGWEEQYPVKYNGETSLQQVVNYWHSTASISPLWLDFPIFIFPLDLFLWLFYLHLFPLSAIIKIPF